MGNIGLLKRALPFLGTFALGLFIASFFVNIGAPRFGSRGKCRHEMRELRIENEQLREENLRLRNGTGASEFDQGLEFNDEFLNSQSVEVPVLPPLPPRPVKPHSVHAK